MKSSLITSGFFVFKELFAFEINCSVRSAAPLAAALTTIGLDSKSEVLRIADLGVFSEPIPSGSSILEQLEDLKHFNKE